MILFRQLRLLTLSLLLTSFLSACAPLIIGGLIAGASVATDRRTSSAQLADKEIYIRANNRLSSTELGNLSYIAIASYNQSLYLVGQVPSETVRQRALEIAKDLPNVIKVVDRLSIKAPISTSTKNSDRWISSKVQSELLITRNVPYRTINILTVDGIVYMFGLVTKEEGVLAANVAAHVKGVKQVVQAFEYLTPEELKSGTINNAANPIINTAPQTTTNALKR